MTDHKEAFNVGAYTQVSSECAYTHYQWYEGFC